MPKSKRSLESTRSRRQASKEALKQMQLLLDDDEDTFVIPDDEDDKDVSLDELRGKTVSPPPEAPPKKKYKLSHRKSSDDRDVIVLKSISNSNYVPIENSLELECYVEELSDVQNEKRLKFEKEESEMKAKIEELINDKRAEVVYEGDFCSAIEVNELISNGNKSILQPSNHVTPVEISTEDDSNFQLVVNPRIGLLMGPQTHVKIAPAPVNKSKIRIAPAVKAVATMSRSSAVTRNLKTRKPTILPSTARGNNLLSAKLTNNVSTRTIVNKGSNSNIPSMKNKVISSNPSIQTRNNKILTKRTFRPVDKSKQVVDLTCDDNRDQVDNKEVSFNKLQGKTYPSLIVVARPHLRVTDLGTDRAKLDSKVKTVLMHQAAKFTEWLIQQGLIRAEQKCPVHANVQLKLGMYSDASKFPLSGGYVWISECCPQRFISVFNGSIFESSSNTPMVMLKLIYHWACQTNIQNVVQWVKVDNLFVKSVYVWLRGICTLSIQSHMKQLGGPGSKVEVGVISLGTTSQDGLTRQVKVEVLGILECSTKLMRLRAIEPSPNSDKNIKKEFSKILEPLSKWVHPHSIIITDMTVAMSTLHNMGFTNVIQNNSSDYNNSNRTIMEYLRKIVPRMFQNTLSLLSRQIIQQFLDELVWREWYGTTTLQAFDNILVHLAEQTRVNKQASLILKLNKVATNPFKIWNTTESTNSTTVTNRNQTVGMPTLIPIQKPVTENKRPSRTRKGNSSVQVQERPTKSTSPDFPEQMVPLENYYYGTIESIEKEKSSVILSGKCPFCRYSYENNLQLQSHLFKHAFSPSNDAHICHYCLTTLKSIHDLQQHIVKTHPSETKFNNTFVCMICENHYSNPFVLGKHMSKEHSPHELPYECGVCHFRCSNHRQIVDHFYKNHDGGTSVQCPFCLKSTTIWSAGKNITQNVQYFMQHLQKHQKKQLVKKCGKCTLSFIQKDILKEHQQNMHMSLRGRLGLIPYTSPRNGVMVPKSKVDKNPCNAEIINFSSLYYNIPNMSVCKECGEEISSEHFPSFDTCKNSHCRYSTCCSTAMKEHKKKCKGLDPIIPLETLPFRMYCVCGYGDIDGNSLAKHLAICEKKSAYSSQSEAKSATVMHSMLDILGLVRKSEEVPPSKTNEEQLVSDKTEDTVEKEETSNIDDKTEPFIPVEEIDLDMNEEETNNEPITIDCDNDEDMCNNDDITEESEELKNNEVEELECDDQTDKLNDQPIEEDKESIEEEIENISEKDDEISIIPNNESMILEKDENESDNTKAIEINDDNENVNQTSNPLNEIDEIKKDVVDDELPKTETTQISTDETTEPNEKENVDKEIESCTNIQEEVENSSKSNDEDPNSLQLLNEELCKESVSENLNEDLDDILSNNVTPMDIDLESELTDITKDAPMDAD